MTGEREAEVVRDDLRRKFEDENPDYGPDVVRSADYKEGYDAAVRRYVSIAPQTETQVRELKARLEREFASAFITIRGAHNPKPGEPCAWCRLAAEQAAEAVVTTPVLDVILDFPEPVR